MLPVEVVKCYCRSTYQYYFVPCPTLQMFHITVASRSQQLLIASKTLSKKSHFVARTLAVQLRGGGHRMDGTGNMSNELQQCSEIRTDLDNRDKQQHHAYTILSDPAPGSPFHYAFPVHDLQLAKEFYGNVLGCIEGRSSTKWQDYSLHGHQIVAHWVGNDYRCQDYYNPVDGDEVPVPRTFYAYFIELLPFCIDEKTCI
jgi:hypothetical protein